jgi:hypothetical protein
LLAGVDAPAGVRHCASGVGKRTGGRADPRNRALVIDNMLATNASEHDLRLVTRNARPVQSGGAVVLNPWAHGEAGRPAFGRSPYRRQRPNIPNRPQRAHHPQRKNHPETTP